MRSFLLSGAMVFATALAAPAFAAAPSAAPCPAFAVSLDVGGATLCIAMDERESAEHRRLLREWILRAARIVADYYDRFPAPLVTLRVRTVPGDGVSGGRTSNDDSLLIEIRVGRDASERSLASDWVLVHEMTHLAFPDIDRRHDWLAEGLATYVEGIARAQAGNRAVADVWAEYRQSMPFGLPRAGEGGMDQTSTWARTYWGGALFCLEADVAIRERTHNQAGLQQALRAILRNTGGYRTERTIEQVLKIGDAATGTGVLGDFYARAKTSPRMPDLELLWHRLGVPPDPNRQPFDDLAPLAHIRLAITERHEPVGR